MRDHRLSQGHRRFALRPRGGQRALARRRARLAARVARDLRGSVRRALETALAAPTVREPITVVWCEDDMALCALFEGSWRMPQPEVGWRPHPEDALHFARNGEEAVRHVQRLRPHLLLTDCQHPGAPDGYELLDLFAARDDMALGLVTGNQELGWDSSWLDLVMHKPVDLRRMYSALHGLVERLRTGRYRPHPDRLRGDGDGA